MIKKDQICYTYLYFCMCTNKIILIFNEGLGKCICTQFQRPDDYSDYKGVIPIVI